MTEKLYYRDAYATKFTARVLDCTEEKKHWTVILNRTLFYPEGGGQPADIGVLGGVRVLDVHERGEDIVHTTESRCLSVQRWKVRLIGSIALI